MYDRLYALEEELLQRRANVEAGEVIAKAELRSESTVASVPYTWPASRAMLLSSGCCCTIKRRCKPLAPRVKRPLGDLET